VFYSYSPVRLAILATTGLLVFVRLIFLLAKIFPIGDLMAFDPANVLR